MRMTVLALVLLAIGCGSPCRDQKIAAASLGGPIGIIFAAAWQCEGEATTPQPQPIATVESSGLQVPDRPDMAASPPDLATPSPDLSRPADMTTPPPPPDLSPVTVSLAASDPANWWLAGPLVRSGNGYAVAASFDFNKVKQVDSTITIPITPLPVLQGRQPRQYDLKFVADFSAAWGATSTTCNLPGRAPSFYVKGPGSPGYSYTCVLPTIGVQFLVDDVVVYDGGVGDFSLQPHYTRSLPLGQVIPVQPGQRLALRLIFNGDVVISGITASATVQESF